MSAGAPTVVRVQTTPKKGCFMCLSEALQNAQPNTTITISAGTYLEHDLHIDQSGLKIVAEGDGVPTLMSHGTTLTISAEVILQGLHIETDDPCSAAVSIVDSKPKFLRCTIQSMHVDLNGQPIVENCTIQGCPHCGLVVTGSAGGEYRNNVIRQHRLHCVLLESSGSPLLVSNQISQSEHGAVVVSGKCTAVLKVNTIQDTMALNVASAVPKPQDMSVEARRQSIAAVAKRKISDDQFRAAIVIANGAAPILDGNTIFGGLDHGIVVIRQYAIRRMVNLDGAVLTPVAPSVPVSSPAKRRGTCLSGEEGFGAAHIIRNNIRNNGCHAIVCSGGGAKAALDSNTIDSNDYGGILVEKGASVASKGDTIRAHSSFSVRATDAGTTLTLVDATLSESECGAKVESEAVLKLTGCTVEKMVFAVSVREHARAEIDSCNVTSNDTGLLVEYHGHCLASNTVFQSNSVGVTAKNHGAPQVKGCTFRRNLMGVQSCSRGDGDVSSSCFTDSNTAHVVVAEYGNTRFVANEFKDSDCSAVICREKGLGVFHDNSFRNLKAATIRIESLADPTFTKNRIECGAAEGVLIEKGGVGLFVGNTISSFATSGVVVRSNSEPTFRDNVITNNSYSGLDIQQSAKGAYEKNTLRDNAKMNVSVSGGGNLMAVLSSNVIEGGPIGIFACDSARSVVHACRITCCKRGIVASRASCISVVDCDVSKNDLGVECTDEGTTGYFARNRIHNNSGPGMVVDRCAAPLALGNWFAGHTDVGVMVRGEGGGRFLHNHVAMNTVGVALLHSSAIWQDNVIVQNGCGVWCRDGIGSSDVSLQTSPPKEERLGSSEKAPDTEGTRSNEKAALGPRISRVRNNYFADNECGLSVTARGVVESSGNTFTRNVFAGMCLLCSSCYVSDEQSCFYDNGTHNLYCSDDAGQEQTITKVASSASLKTGLPQLDLGTQISAALFIGNTCPVTFTNTRYQCTIRDSVFVMCPLVVELDACPAVSGCTFTGANILHDSSELTKAVSPQGKQPQRWRLCLPYCICLRQKAQGRISDCVVSCAEDGIVLEKCTTTLESCSVFECSSSGLSIGTGCSAQIKSCNAFRNYGCGIRVTSKMVGAGCVKECKVFSQKVIPIPRKADPPSLSTSAQLAASVQNNMSFGASPSHECTPTPANRTTTPQGRRGSTASSIPPFNESVSDESGPTQSALLKKLPFCAAAQSYSSAALELPSASEDCVYCGIEVDTVSKLETDPVPKYACPPTEGCGVGILVDSGGGGTFEDVSCFANAIANVLINAKKIKSVFVRCQLYECDCFGMVVRANATAEVNNCFIINNQIAGLLAEPSSSAILSRTAIHGNLIGGVMLGDTTDISRCIFSSNRICGLRFGEQSHTHLHDSEFFENGCGIECRYSINTTPSIEYCDIHDNQYCGVLCTGFSKPTIDRNRIALNGAVGGVVIRCSSKPLVTNNVIEGNAAGIVSRLYCEGLVDSNNIRENRVGAIVEWRGGGTFARNQFQGNKENAIIVRTSGAGLFCSNLFVADSTIAVSIDGAPVFVRNTFRKPMSSCFEITRGGNPTITACKFAFLHQSNDAFVPHSTPSTAAVTPTAVPLSSVEQVNRRKSLQLKRKSILVRSIHADGTEDADAQDMRKFLAVDNTSISVVPSLSVGEQPIPTEPPVDESPPEQKVPIVIELGGRGVIKGCLFTANAPCSVLIDGATSDPIIEGNAFLHHPEVALVCLNYCNPVVRGNYFMKNKLAIQLARTAAIVKDCYFLSNTTSIESHAAVTGIVTNNVFIDDNLAINFLSGTGLGARTNVFFRCDNAAYFDKGASGSFTGNSCVLANCYALSVQTDLQNTTLTQNLLFQGHGGVHVCPTGVADLAELEIVAVDGIGILFSSDAMGCIGGTGRISNCKVNGCSVGVSVTGDDTVVQVQDTTFSMCRVGAEITHSANPTFQSCKFLQNRLGLSIHTEGLGSVKRCEFIANFTALSQKSGNDVAPLISHCNILDCEDIAVSLAGDAKGLLTDCNIFDSKAGIVASACAATRIEHTNISQPGPQRNNEAFQNIDTAKVTLGSSVIVRYDHSPPYNQMNSRLRKLEAMKMKSQLTQSIEKLECRFRDEEGTHQRNIAEALKKLGVLGDVVEGPRPPPSTEGALDVMPTTLPDVVALYESQLCDRQTQQDDPRRSSDPKKECAPPNQLLSQNVVQCTAVVVPTAFSIRPPKSSGSRVRFSIVGPNDPEDPDVTPSVSPSETPRKEGLTPLTPAFAFGGDEAPQAPLTPQTPRPLPELAKRKSTLKLPALVAVRRKTQQLVGRRSTASSKSGGSKLSRRSRRRTEVSVSVDVAMEEAQEESATPAGGGAAATPFATQPPLLPPLADPPAREAYPRAKRTPDKVTGLCLPQLSPHPPSRVAALCFQHPQNGKFRFSPETHARVLSLLKQHNAMLVDQILTEFRFSDRRSLEGLQLTDLAAMIVRLCKTYDFHPGIYRRSQQALREQKALSARDSSTLPVEEQPFHSFSQDDLTEDATGKPGVCGVTPATSLENFALDFGRSFFRYFGRDVDTDLLNLEEFAVVVTMPNTDLGPLFQAHFFWLASDTPVFSRRVVEQEAAERRSVSFCES